MSDSESAGQLKEALNAQAMKVIASVAKRATGRFDGARFLQIALADLDNLSIMERMAQAADALRESLPGDYLATLETLRAMAPKLPAGFVSMVLPEMVARHGVDHFEASLDALEWLTSFSTAEFAMRPFLISDLDKALHKALQWTEHSNEHVRTLASEATRPRLPWAKRLPILAANPQLSLPILERLRADPSRYVQRSVANHLNDIVKQDQEWVLDLIEGWPKDSEHTRWIIKHAIRNMIKAGHPRALAAIGASTSIKAAANFAVDTKEVTLGDHMCMSASLLSQAETSQKIVLDYAVSFARNGGKVHRKVFKWRTCVLEAGQIIDFKRSHHFVDRTTRKHVAGLHKIELLVNGDAVAKFDFLLAIP